MYYNFDIENLRYQLCTKAESSFWQMEICKFWKSVTCPQKKFWLRYDLEAIYVKKKAMRNSTKYKFYLNQIEDYNPGKLRKLGKLSCPLEGKAQ